MYYSLEHKVDAVFPQVSCLTQIDAHRLDYHEFPKLNPNLVFKLEKKAKFTDVLSQAAISAHGLLISSKLKEVLQDFKLMQHHYFDVLVKSLKGDKSYSWLHLFNSKLLDYVHYELSKFYRTEFGYREEDLQLASYSDYKTKKEFYGKTGTIQSDLIKLTNEFPSELDLFALPLFDNNIYISDRLMETLNDKGIDGIELNKASTLVT